MDGALFIVLLVALVPGPLLALVGRLLPPDRASTVWAWTCGLLLCPALGLVVAYWVWIATQDPANHAYGEGVLAGAAITVLVVPALIGAIVGVVWRHRSF